MEPQERFELMPGAKLLPRSPEVGWALRDEDGVNLMVVGGRKTKELMDL